ncbi:MAG: D-alanyl-D-alanine carboxypeptidase family protein [Acidimicrobiia bacterium]|nr:D-alanyl-D-alanine carboxypeptidase family protein [Acidimicrobiia bacterium]
MTFRVRTVAILAILSLAAAPPIPIERIPPVPSPEIGAPAWVLYDETIGSVLDGVEVDTPRAMASTTKLMTALLAVESGMLDEVVTVSARAAAVGESEIGLVAGERIRLDMLVAALVIRSGNDAAMAVAEHVGGTVEDFVALMNQRAAELGMAQTSFANPHGLDAEAHFSTPRDLVTLARAATSEPFIAELMGTSRYRITDSPDGTVRVAESTNRLLETYPGTVGGKTGFTFRAGLVYVGSAEREGRRLYVAVMGSEGADGHFRDAAALFDHGFDAYRIVDTITRGASYVAGDDEPTDEVASLARLHALALIGRLTHTEQPEADVPEPAPVSVTLRPDLPGPGEALRWLWSGNG